MKKAKSKRQRGNGSHIAKKAGIFGRDLALDAAGELLDLGVGTLAGLGTFGFYSPQPGEFNPRRSSTAGIRSRNTRRMGKG